MRTLSTKFFLVILPLILFFVLPSAAAQSTLSGNWTGGFWLEENWVAVNVRFNREREILSGTADIVFPSYENTSSARNVNITSLKFDSAKISFEIPFGSDKVVLRGQIKESAIAGNYDYGSARGNFGLTRLADVRVESLEKLYGAYRAAPDRIISIFRNWGNPQTLGYMDYQTGQTGMLWPFSEKEFFSGSARSVSYPIALKVSFDENGNLIWNEGRTNFTARKLPFREEQIIFKNGDTTLGGTLILPVAKGRYPVVVVTPGDFGTNRNQLRIFAHNFVSRGAGAFIFDSRGAGQSTGSVGINSFSDMADDVLSAVRWLKEKDDVSPKQIGLFGFSNSAWTITLAASRSTDVGFLILQSMSGVEPWKQEIFRAESQVRSDGFSEEVIRQTADFMRLKFTVARTGEGWEQIERIMENARGERWLAYTNPPRSLERTRQVWQRSMTYNPVPALEKITVPVLAYWGEYDTYVPVEESVAVFKRAMAKAKNKDYTIKIFPKARHGMIEGESGSPSIGARLKKFPTNFWEMQIDWLSRHVKASK
jgi:uncharacterized protein